MSDELFPVEAVAMDSPRLAWMKKYGVTTVCHDWTGTDLQGSCEPPWQAFAKGAHWTDKTGAKRHDGSLYDTEDAAIAGLAIWCDIKLWNEETTA